MNDINDYKFHYCTTFDEVKQLVAYCKQTGWCCNDFETNADSYVEPTSFPTILSISFQPGSAWVVPLAHKDSPLKHIYKQVIQYIGIELIENTHIIKIAQNLKFEYNWWRKYNIIPRGILLDTMLAKYLLNEERPHGLKEMVSMFIPEFAGYDLPNQPGDKAERPKLINFWTNVPIMELSKYGALDADLTFRLWIFFEQRIRDSGFYPLLRNLLMMATRVLADVEYTGMYTDRDYLNNLLKVYSDKIANCEREMRNLPELVEYETKRINQIKRFWINDAKNEIKRLKEQNASQRVISTREQKLSRFLVGEFTTKKDKELLEPINFGSPKQLAELFFYNDFGFEWDILAFTQNKKTKKYSNTPSLDEENLLLYKKKYKHPFLDQLLELRGLSKLNSTYVVGMWEKLHTNNRIHGSFLIHGCITRDTILVGKEKDIIIGDIVPSNPLNLTYVEEDISDRGLMVLTHTGSFKKITHGINKGLLETWEISDKYGNLLKCTPNHKLYTVLGWKTVKEIIDGDIYVIMENTDNLLITRQSVIKPEFEEFKQIQDWPGYIVSNIGNVYSTKIPGTHGVIGKVKHRLVTRLNKRGVPRVGLRNNSKKIMFNVSRLVAKAFIGDIPEGYVVDHKDCNPLNNWVTNLQIITYSNNTARAYENTRNSFTRGEKNGSSKFNKLDISKILLLKDTGRTQKGIAKEFNTTQRHIGRIWEGKAWGNIYLTKIRKNRDLGLMEIVDLTVEEDHSYITRSNFINKNTVTGRLSSRNPNLQNIPRDTTASDIKKMFVCPPGRLILQLDYSQAELRVLAFLAKEDTMMEWFNSGHDIHLATACKKYGVEYKDIEKILNDENHPDFKTWKIRRKQAKTTNFGIAYEQGKKALAEKLTEQGVETTPDEAEQILKDWFKDFPKVKKYINKQHKLAKEQGYVKTMFGRKRRLQALLESGNTWKEAEALRLSVNAPIQGTASDFALFSSVLIREEIIKGNLPSTLEQFGTVHDSIMYYIEPKDIHWVVPILSKICANPDTKEWFGFEIKGVEMKADFEIGKSWGELRSYNKEEDYTKWV